MRGRQIRLCLAAILAAAGRATAQEYTVTTEGEIFWGNVTTGIISRALCYKIEWNLASAFVPSSAILPIEKFPNAHPSTNTHQTGDFTCSLDTLNVPLAESEQPCDVFPVGSTIPVSGSGPYTRDNTCQNMTGAELFYAWHFPCEFSANTGHDDPESLTVYMIVDEADEVFLVLTLDKPNTDPGGYMAMDVTSTQLEGKGVEVVLMDDFKEIKQALKKCARPARPPTPVRPPACSHARAATAAALRRRRPPPLLRERAPPLRRVCDSPSSRLTAAVTLRSPPLRGSNITFPLGNWNSTTAQGSFYWQWKVCCTDGMVLGPMPRCAVRLHASTPLRLRARGSGSRIPSAPSLPPPPGTLPPSPSAPPSPSPSPPLPRARAATTGR